MLGGESRLTTDERANLLHHYCLKAVVYIARNTVLTGELKARLLTTFHEIPLVVVRAHTLPKNAPIELEILALASKS